jgi:hypothetical protein
VALALLAVWGSAAVAQSLTGSVQGTVKDEQGGVLPGVTVTLVGKTGTRTAVTDTAGSYRFVALDPGYYTVRAEMQGFQPRRQDNINISIGTALDVDFGLKVGGLTDAVDVVGEAPVVDTTSTATNNALSQDILYNMPLDRRSFNLLNYAPGINDGAAFGGATDSANGLLLDGVDTRDPYGGTAWTFFNYNIIEEVKIQGLGAPAEYGAYTGAVINTVSRSGGNRHQGLFDLTFTNDSLAGNNVSDEVKRLNPAGVGDPNVTTHYVDVTGQLSGPIVKDKVFFFTSVQRFSKTEDPSGPRTRRKELSHRANAKLTIQPNPNDNLSINLQADDYSINGRPNAIAGAALSTDSMTVAEDAPELVWSAQWRHLFGANTFLEAKYLGWWGYFYLDPENPAPLRFDGATSQYTGGAGYISYSDRGRHQINASVSHYAQAFGRHDLKFGVEVERSKVRERFGYTGYFYDYGGTPTYQYQYSYDLEGRNRRNSVYAQDSWKPNERLTINAGVRFDQAQGASPVLDKTVYDTKSFSPRIGFAWDVTGDHSTVLKAHYGRYYEGAFFSFYSGALPGIKDFVTLDAVTGAEISRSPTPIARVDGDIKQPRVDEFTAGFERALGRDVRLAVTGIWRDNKNFISPVLPSARWAPINVANRITGGNLGVYSWVNPATSDQDYFITNPDGFVYRDAAGNPLGTAEASRDYKGLMVVLNRAFKNRWQAQVSYVLSKSEGTVDSDDAESFGQGRQFQTPTRALVNTFGEVRTSRRHEIKLYASYLIPRAELQVNAYFRSLSGRTYTPFERFSSRVINFSPSFRGRQPLLEPRGSRKLGSEHVLDLRLEKLFNLGDTNRVSVYADIANVFNTGVVTRPVERVPSESIGNIPVPFGGPRALTPARQVTLGARWSF